MHADSHVDQTTPAQAQPMRLVALLLAVVLLAAACGGDDAPATGDVQTDATPAAADDVDDLPLTDASERTDQPDADPEPAPRRSVDPEPAPQLPVRLGNRFGWCAPIQQAWDRFAETWMVAHGAELAYYKIQNLLEGATDELDKAEAWNVYVLAEEDYDRALQMLADAAEEVVAPLAPVVYFYSGEETERIAIGRARDVFFAAAAPELAELIRVALRDISRPQMTSESAAAAAPELMSEIAEFMFEAEPMVEEPGREASPADQTRLMEEYLAAIDPVHDEVARLRDESETVKSAASDAYHDIRFAQQVAEAMDAYERFQEALASIREIFTAARTEYDNSRSVYDSYVDSGGDQRPFPGRDDIREIAASIPRFAPHDFDPDSPKRWFEIRDVSRLVDDALQEVTTEFILADPAWRAFQVSLAESCQR